MFSKLDHPPVSFDDYRPFLDPKLADDLAAVAGEMGQLRVLHLNSTATGGGVAEILQSMVPLGNSLGIETERIVINPDSAEFFDVTKKITTCCRAPRANSPRRSWTSISAVSRE